MSDRVINSLHSESEKYSVHSTFFPVSPTSKVYGEEQGAKEVEDVKHCSLWLLVSGITLHLMHPFSSDQIKPTPIHSHRLNI